MMNYYSPSMEGLITLGEIVGATAASLFWFAVIWIAIAIQRRRDAVRKEDHGPIRQ